MTRTGKAILMAGVVLVPGAASAQGDPYASVSFATTQTYDDNLFPTVASDRQRDLIFRAGPTIEAGYVSVPLKVVARYGFEAERYLDHVAFNKAFARQDAALELYPVTTRRLAVDARASYVETQTPYEFNVETGLTAVRARAQRFSAGPSATYEWSPVTRLSFGYQFTSDALAGGFRAVVHNANLGFERHVGGTQARRLDYQIRHFSFDDRPSEVWHVVTAGWSRAITRRTHLEFALGPRLANRVVRPELTAALRRRLQKGELSASYSRTQATAIGEPGAVDTQRVAGGFVYQAGRRVTLTATPAFMSSARDRVRVSVYLLALEAAGRPTRGLSVVASGHIGLQQGTLDGRRDQIPYRSLSLRLVATLPRTSRIAHGQPSAP
jgi:hypothetical protein